jgi:putative endonuclease
MGGLDPPTQLSCNGVMAAGFVYILTGKPYGTLYIGVTSNLHERMMQHQAGIGSAFVKKYDVTREDQSRMERPDRELAPVSWMAGLRPAMVSFIGQRTVLSQIEQQHFARRHPSPLSLGMRRTDSDFNVALSTHRDRPGGRPSHSGTTPYGDLPLDIFRGQSYDCLRWGMRDTHCWPLRRRIRKHL